LKVTIVTPVFNGMPWLPECVESVAAQRRDVELEHFVYDGGSTDGSAEWLRRHVSLGYEAIIGPDEGQTDALVRGFERATGEVLGWLNADDVLEPGAIKRVVDVFAADSSLAMVAGVCLIIDSDGAIIGAMPPPRVATLTGLLRLPNNPAQPATFFTAEAYRTGGGLDRRYDLAMDIDLWLKLAEVGPMKTMVTDVLARYREHPDAKSIARSPASARQSFAIRRKHGMPLRSSAAIQLVRAGFVLPITSPVTRPARRVIRRLVLGTSYRDLTST
jgi:glycosyltransferase involved in cell wall biosynthesis